MGTSQSHPSLQGRPARRAGGGDPEGTPPTERRLLHPDSTVARPHDPLQGTVALKVGWEPRGWRG